MEDLEFISYLDNNKEDLQNKNKAKNENTYTIIKDMELRLSKLECDLQIYKVQMRKREYLINTNFIGSLTDKTLIEEMSCFINKKRNYIPEYCPKIKANCKKLSLKEIVLDLDIWTINYVWQKLMALEKKQNKE